MPEPNRAQSKAGQSESDQQGRLPLTARALHAPVADGHEADVGQRRIR